MTVAMDHRRTTAARFVLPVIILAAALIGHLFVVREGERRTQQRVEERGQRVADALEGRVGDYGGVLYGVRGLFSASRHVTVGEFHASHTSRGVEDLCDRCTRDNARTIEGSLPTEWW